jgi:hypothetical protein
LSDVFVETLTTPGADVVDYLDRSEDGSIFHGQAWATVLERSYGHETLYFIARDRSTVRGVFVIVRQRMWPFGEKWVALPYQFHSGPPIADDSETAATLIRAAIKAARASAARYLEVRTSRFSDVMQAEGLVRLHSGLQVTNLDLRTHQRGMIRRSTRAEVRHAAEGGVTIEHVPAAEGMKAFLGPYLRDMRDLGSPQAGRRFFDALVTEMPGALHMVLARRQGEVIGSLFVLGDRRATFARGSAGTMTPISREHFVGKALMYAAIEAARERGVAIFSMGITWEGNSGLNAYKSGWGGTTTPIESFVATLKGKAPTPGDYFGGYQFARKMWQKMPLFMAEPVGHRVTQWIG